MKKKLEKIIDLLEKILAELQGVETKSQPGGPGQPPPK